MSLILPLATVKRDGGGTTWPPKPPGSKIQQHTEGQTAALHWAAPDEEQSDVKAKEYVALREVMFAECKKMFNYNN